MHRAHDPRQNRAVADAGVEHPDGRRRRMDVGEFQRDAIGDLGLLAAGRDEQEILLPVVEEPEARRRPIGFRLAARRAAEPCLARPPQAGFQRRWPAHGQIELDLIERFGGNPRAVAEAGDKFSVVDDAASEGRFRGPRFATEIPDLAEDLLVRRGRWLALASFEIYCPIPRSALCGKSSGEPSWCQPQSEWADGVGARPLLWARVGRRALLLAPTDHQGVCYAVSAARRLSEIGSARTGEPADDLAPLGRRLSPSKPAFYAKSAV